VGICHAGESWCNDRFARSLPEAERVEITPAVTFLGMSRPPASYVLYLVPGCARR
jgi:hypothetical protein